ncbi:TetR/AcrR family transcriptional regulator [Nocardiopsis lucentensis]|uniref:TetR/AcrR family transcriptional regulator n=1 Tax=Nocardiopsis lucentensis TaxID=53441 RepID=UPI00034C3285|nr:TetR/AcrR family transcriptional regulator [Nocardiopsis lucentensis]
MARTRSKSGELTLTERARRAQLIEATVELVADRGFAGVALSGIAERAGITKAAVLYHFPSKDAVVRAARDHVLSELAGHVAAEVEAAAPEGAPAAYVRSMVGYLREHPRHTRMITEALTHGGEGYEPAERWGPLAEIIDGARRARGAHAGRDTRTLAIIVGGAIDGIVAERLSDPEYDTAAAAEQLVDLIDAALGG